MPRYTAAIALGWTLFATYLLAGGLSAPWDVDESFRGQVVFNLAAGQRVNIDFITFYIEPLFQLLSYPIVLFPAPLLPYAMRGFGLLCALFAALAIARTLLRLNKLPAGLLLAAAPLSMILVVDVAARLYHYRANALSYGLILLALGLLFIEPRRKRMGGLLLGGACACQLEAALPATMILLLCILWEQPRDKIAIPICCGAGALLPGLLLYGPVDLFRALLASLSMGKIVPVQFGPRLPLPLGNQYWFLAVLGLWLILTIYGLWILRRLGYTRFVVALLLVMVVHLCALAWGAQRIYWQHFTLELLLAAPAAATALVLLIQRALMMLRGRSNYAGTAVCCALITLVWAAGVGRLAQERIGQREADPALELSQRMLPGDDCASAAMNNFYRPYALAQAATLFGALAYSCPAPQTHYGDELYDPQLPHIPVGITGIYQQALHLRQGFLQDPAKERLLELPIGVLGREIFEECPAEYLMHNAPCALLEDPMLYRVAAADLQFREWLLGNYQRIVSQHDGRPIVLFIRKDRPLAPTWRKIRPDENIGLFGLLKTEGPDER